MGDTLTPSQQIIADANQAVTVTDGKGRQVVLRRLRGRNLARFMRACGPMADVATYFGEAILRASIVSVDGAPMPPLPVNADQVDALFERVDADALTAAVQHFAAQAEAKADAV